MTGQDQNNRDQEDVKLYEKLLKRVEEAVESGRKNLDDALKKASEEFTAAGHFTREQSEKIVGYIRKDVQHAAQNAEKAKDSIREAVDPQRVAAGAQSFFARVLSGAASTLEEWAQKSEQQLEFKTGEITSPGTLTCKNCNEPIHMKKTGRIPPCPKCHQTRFRKSY